MSQVVLPARLHDLLYEPLFEVWCSPPGRPDLPRPDRVTLPQAVAHLLTGTDLRFQRLPVEMEGAWWRLLGRLAARALHEWATPVAKVEGLSPDVVAARLAATWEQLAPQPAWHLWVSDPYSPAFEQPPLPKGTASAYTPAPISDLTLALGGKNHERKTRALSSLEPDAVAYHLAALQNGAIYGGSGYYGSQLMGSKSGAGSGCPFIGVWIGDSSSRTFRYDVAVFLDRWDRIKKVNQLRGKIWALWVEPWDGSTSIPSHRLDPAFLPLGRLLRLGAPEEDGGYRSLFVARAGCDRVSDHTGGGDLGDPWLALVPQPKAKTKAWNGGTHKVRGTMAGGYGYSEVLHLLHGDGCIPAPVVAELSRQWPHRDPACDPDSPANQVWVRCEGIAYGQGKTEGFHARRLLLPTQIQFLLADPSRSDVVVELLLNGVKEARTVLRNATRVYLAGSPSPKKGDDDRVSRVSAGLDQRVDTVFLHWLAQGLAVLSAPVSTAPSLTASLPDTSEPWRGDWEGEELSGQEGAPDALAGWLEDWCQWLRSASLETWADMRPSLPCPQDRIIEREVLADLKLRGQLSKLAERVRSQAATDGGNEPENEADADPDEGSSDPGQPAARLG